VGELIAPLKGGVQYETTGYFGVVGVRGGIVVLNCLMRDAVIEKKTLKNIKSLFEMRRSTYRTLGHGLTTIIVKAIVKHRGGCLLPKKEDEPCRVREKTHEIFNLLQEPGNDTSFLLLVGFPSGGTARCL
jgi:hypothetical protein